MKKLNSIIDYAKKINRLDYFSRKIAMDDFMTFLEKRELDDIQEEIAEYEQRNFNGEMPDIEHFLKAFTDELSISVLSENKRASKKNDEIIDKYALTSVDALINKRYILKKTIRIINKHIKNQANEKSYLHGNV